MDKLRDERRLQKKKNKEKEQPKFRLNQIRKKFERNFSHTLVMIFILTNIFICITLYLTARVKYLTIRSWMSFAFLLS